MTIRTRLLRRPLSWLAVLATAVTTLTASAQLHPSLERGFSPDKAFQVGEIDHVNLFNGNVTLTVPLGPPSKISEQLSLGLVASYNSKLWQMHTEPATPGVPAVKHMIPERISNAGLGWVVSLGELVGPEESNVDPGLSLSYHAPDGSTHGFSPLMHPNDPETPGAAYSTDGTYLRLRQSGTHYFVDFPDGITQEFEPWLDGTITRYRLLATRDPHGNYHTIDYSVADEWTIKDQYDRKTIVQFSHRPPAASGRPFAYRNFETTVDNIRIPGFNGQIAKYQFTYDTVDVRRGYCGQEEPTADDKYVAVSLLKKIELFHGATSIGAYVADYDLSLQPPTAGTVNDTCKAGTITSMKLPTQATIRWTYGNYYLPGDCRAELATDKSAGVLTRIYDAPTSGQFSSDPDGTWTYLPQLTIDPPQGFDCGTSHFFGSPPAGEMTNTVTSPTGDQVIHYFSVWPVGRFDSPHGEDKQDFGLPFSRRAGSVNGMYLSTKVCKGLCTSPGNPLRTTYVAYERDANTGSLYNCNRRLSASRTVYNDDADHYVQTQYSNFDGVGHYRTALVTGDFGDGMVTRSSYTAFNVRDAAVSNSSQVLNTGTYDSTTGTGFTVPPVTHPWILNTFSSVISIQDSESRTRYACFDPLLGDLRATRVLNGVSVAPQDLLTVLDRSADPDLNGSSPGFVTQESFYGGDATPLQPTSQTALCDYVNSTGATDKPRPLGFRANHTYAYGARATSTFEKPDGTAMPFKALDLEIDISGLAKTARDTAGVATLYTYDASNRLTKIEPPGMAAIDYVYTPATSSVRANVAATQVSTTGTVKREIHFDSLGRPAVEKRTVDSVLLRSRNTTYNGIGWKTSVGEWGNASATTFGNFDAFGRPQTITAPDGSSTTMSYAGERQTTATTNFQSPGGTDSTTVTKRRDAFGRINEVSELSGPTTANTWNGVAVTTKYSFDLVDHLTKVEIMPTGGTTQTRTFAYDGRGFLTSETQPELDGTVSYSHDALGHMMSRSFSTASALDLTYAYDPAGNLTDVFSKFNGANRLSKHFVFGSSGADNGRLRQAQRYNYRPASADHFLVTEDYAYDGDGRIASRNTTIDRVIGGVPTTVRSFAQSKTYNDLGLTETIAYPQCVNCGSTTRTVTPGYSNGILTSIPGFLTSISHAASGMTTQVVHTNGISDVITAPATGEARPAAIRFDGTCTTPVITVQPADKDVERSAPFFLEASVTGSGLTYQWFQRPTSTMAWSPVSGGTAARLDTSVSGEMFFRLTISNSCDTVNTREVHVTVFDLPTITTQPASETIPAGQSRTLSVTASGTAPLSYQWYQGASGVTSQPIPAPAGTQSSYTTPLLWATTSYWVRVSNSHGQINSQTATLTMQLAAPTGMTATRFSDAQINVTWNASSGAGQYRLERRSGSGFVFRAIITAPVVSFSDTTVVANKSYVYQVFAEDSGGGSDSVASNQDLATTIDFASVQTGALITVNPFDQLLAGVNALRSAASAGATPLTWSTLVSAPTPGTGTQINVSALNALRTQLNLARGSLGFPDWTFTDSSPTLIKAIHITQLQDALR